MVEGLALSLPLNLYYGDTMANKIDFRDDSAASTVFEALGFPEKTEWPLKEIHKVAESLNVEKKILDPYLNKQTRSRHGFYNFAFLLNPGGTPQPIQTPSKKVSNAMPFINSDEVTVPEVDETYVTWGHFNDLNKIIKSNQFFPVFISGLSGNGKTMMVEQVCAKLKREYVRVQISPETDEDSLIGGFRLINGETVFHKGPVIRAMESGAVLLIDEIDRATNRIMCLQGVLEGKPVMIKKTGEVVSPAPGFNVVATANTKGQGSDDGKFSAATIIDEAFLERFVITLEQPYPTQASEKKIVLTHMNKYDCLDEEFADILTIWSDVIRSTYRDGGVDEIISTRRLCHIVKTYGIFSDRMKAIKLCLARFDEENQSAFIDLFTKVNPAQDKPADETSVDDVLNEIVNEIVVENENN